MKEEKVRNFLRTKPEHLHVVARRSTGPTFRRVIVRRSKVVADLMSQSELRHLRWNARVVIHESDDSRVERATSALVHSLTGCLGVRLVLLANSAGSTRRRRHPRQAKRSASEVSASLQFNFIFAQQTRSTNSPISEHICQAEYFVISKRVKIQEIRHVDVLHAELIRLATVMCAARLIIVNFDSLYFETNVAVLDSSVELRIAINEIDSCNVMCNK